MKIKAFQMGWAMRRMRTKRGIDLYKAAECLGVTSSCLCRYELGSRPIPDEIIAKAVCYYGCPSLAEARCAQCAIKQAASKFEKAA